MTREKGEMRKAKSRKGNRRNWREGKERRGKEKGTTAKRQREERGKGKELLLYLSLLIYLSSRANIGDVHDALQLTTMCNSSSVRNVNVRLLKGYFIIILVPYDYHNLILLLYYWVNYA